MFRERARTLQGFSLTLDFICICTGFATAVLLRLLHDSIPGLNRIPAVAFRNEGAVQSDYAILLAVSVVAWMIGLRTSGVYLSHRAETLPAVLRAYVQALLWALLATASVVFILKLTFISRIFFVYYFASAFLLLVLKQLAVIQLLHAFRGQEHNVRHALVIGNGKPASWFARVLKETTHTGYNLTGLLLTKRIVSADTFALPVLGSVEEIDSVLRDHPVDEVFIVGGARDLTALAPVADDLIRKGRVVSLVSALTSDSQNVRGRVTEFAGVPMISFGPMPRDEVNSAIKRVIDVGAASAALVLLAPLFFTIACLIKIFDPGPILFSQARVGAGGAHFQLKKFRTMRVDAEAALTKDPELYARYIANDCKIPEGEDPRVSALGRFLRKTSLDELPQLWNVLLGEMTLVGPRPILPAQLENYAPYEPLFLAVRPGITGRWQVTGRSDITYPERAHIDLDYVAAHSVKTDFGILLRTLPAVLWGRGAY